MQATVCLHLEIKDAGMGVTLGYYCLAHAAETEKEVGPWLVKATHANIQKMPCGRCASEQKARKRMSK